MSVILSAHAFAQSGTDPGYPTVDDWIKGNNLKVQGSWDKDYLEIALLHNLRLHCIHNAIPVTSYRAMLDEVVLQILAKEPGESRGSAFNATRDYLLASMSIAGPPPKQPLDDSTYPAVAKWLKDHGLKIEGSWDKAYMELAVLHNFRFVCMRNRISADSYTEMMNEAILPVLKRDAGADRGARLLGARNYLLRSVEEPRPQSLSPGMLMGIGR
jgi:hypothetical protein